MERKGIDAAVHVPEPVDVVEGTTHIRPLTLADSEHWVPTRATERQQLANVVF